MFKHYLCDFPTYRMFRPQVGFVKGDKNKHNIFQNKQALIIKEKNENCESFT